MKIRQMEDEMEERRVRMKEKYDEFVSSLKGSFEKQKNESLMKIKQLQFRNSEVSARIKALESQNHTLKTRNFELNFKVKKLEISKNQ